MANGELPIARYSFANRLDRHLIRCQSPGRYLRAFYGRRSHFWQNGRNSSQGDLPVRGLFVVHGTGAPIDTMYLAGHILTGPSSRHANLRSLVSRQAHMLSWEQPPHLGKLTPAALRTLLYSH